MKSDIQPTYHTDAKVTCACGNTFTTGSTKEKLETEICHKCHPFYTGEEKLIDTAGRVERFKKRREKAKAEVKSQQEKKEEKKKERKKRQTKKRDEEIIK